VTNDPELHAKIAFHQNAEGAGLAPFEAWLLHRGIKTLDLRVERQNNSALKIAEFLREQPIVNQVYYPGLSTHPGFDVHARQASGGGAVISFTTGDPAISKRIVESCTLFDIAVSFGSVGSVISMPCTMSHASVPAALREKLAPPSDLIRISVGIEAVDDLIADLENAFEKAEPLFAVAAAGIA
jgi:cystathionine beta-lyase